MTDLVRPAGRRRRWPFVLGGLALGGLLVFGALFIPAVQGWILKRVIARQPGWSVNFEKFVLGPSGLDARGLDFAMPGLTAKSAPIAVQISPSRLLRGELRVDQVDVRKLRLELTPASLPSSPSAVRSPTAPPFDGVLALLRSPFAWAVHQTNIDAQLAVNDAGHAVVTGDLSVRGGGVTAVQAGEFAYEISAASVLLPPGPDNVVKSRGTLRVTQNATHGIERLELKGDFTLPRYGPLVLPAGTIDLAVIATPQGERYTATIALGPGGSFTLAGNLDRPTAKLVGLLTFHADQSLAASLAGEKIPSAALDGKIDFAVDLKTNDLDATLTGDLAARDWQKILPQLAVVDALAGKLAAGLRVRGGRAELRSASLALSGATSPLAFRAELAAPLALTPALGAARATVSLAHVPIAWANPWLPPTAQLAPGEFSGAWQLNASPATREVQLTPTRPAEIAALQIVAPALPALPPLTLRFSPRLDASAARAQLSVDDFTIATPDGDRLLAQLAASHEFATARTQLAGELIATLPTLLSGADRPVPFDLAARWDATLTGSDVRVTALELTARENPAAPPAISLVLRQPLEISAGKAQRADSSVDLLTFTANDLSLAWLSRWLPDYTLAGRWAAGQSALRHAPDGEGFVFTTRVPWHFAALGIDIGGKNFFRGRAALAPEFAFRPGLVTASLRGLDLAEETGNRLGGEATFEWRSAEKKFASTLALDATLPALPHSAGTFGALTATLRAQASSMEQKVSQLEKFRLELRNAAGPLVTIDTPEPLLFATKASGETIFSSVAPLSVAIASVPLAWLRPWLPADTTIAGT
ncbi:MAG: hypothetical protein ABIZ49_08535, partial [Opitutaceae bacterium]